ncbi:succinylarginine dihydrolase [Salmonella bongori]|nr:succinylarginine dihydrolase [Salmonella bongori]
MKALADAGFPQAVIPPHERPFIPALRQLGFSGSDEQILDKVSRQAPALAFQRELRFANVGSECGDGVSVRRRAWMGKFT